MEIKIQLPRLHDAEVEVNKADGVVIIRPKFQNKMQTKVLQNIEVVGKGGTTNKFQVAVAGATGRLKVEAIKEVVSAFDELPGPNTKA